MTSRLVERRYLLAAAVTVAAYYAAAQIGIHLAYPHTGTSTYGVVTAFWPPVGVGIAALVLFGVNPLDPVTYILTTIGLCFAAGAASCIPALKATRADSVVALRSE